MADALWTVDELLRATGGTLHGEVRKPLTAVTIDSRAVGAGDIFVAIKGERHDGHDFVAAALKAGAGLGLVSRVTPEMLASAELAAALRVSPRTMDAQVQHALDLTGPMAPLGEALLAGQLSAGHAAAIAREYGSIRPARPIPDRVRNSRRCTAGDSPGTISL